MTTLAIVGAGGFGREVLAIARAQRGGGWRDVVFFDDDTSRPGDPRIQRLAVPLGGTVDDLLGRSRMDVVIAIGDPVTRKAIAIRIHQAGHAFPTLRHPDSTLAPDVELSPGTVVCPGARISTGVSLGVHLHVDQNATVGHDCVIGDFVRLNPSACISGEVSIEQECLVGANATVLPRLSLGQGSLVGAGAVVTRGVPDSTTVLGVPARQRGDES